MFETLSDRLSKAFSFLRDKKELTEESIEEGLREVRTALLEADVNFKVVKEFTERVRARLVGAQRIQGVDPSQQFVASFHHELVALLGPEEARLEFAKNGPTIILMAGLQGAGKTTTCAKLAKHLREKHQKRPVLVAADVKRPAAVEQLRVLGRQLNVPVFHEAGLAPPELCSKGVAYARAAGADVVILDTAGRLHVDSEMMEEVRAIARATNPHVTLLVVDAMTGQDAVQSAKSFHEALELTGVVLTKLDGDARGGSAVSLKAVTGKPILFVGVGEKIDDLDAFHPERMAGRILGMGDVVGLVEKAQSAISEKEAQANFEKMVLGEFTLEDMLAQLRMIRKLGPMKKVLGMMPGMGDLAKNIDIDDRQMNRLEALFTSMTPRERLSPEVLDMSRRRRVARGAGQDVSAVNDLLKRFKEMRQLMKQLNKMGLASQFGAKQKAAALREMSPTGDLEASLGGGGLLSGLGSGIGSGLGSLGRGVGGLFGRGGGAAPPGAGQGGMPGLPGGMGDLGGLFGGGPRPMGSSATRQSGSKKKKDKKKRKKR
ncbi:MAG: signal recognition particle protein [Planctomycetota bacterium]|nr:signal recognition particle protein [Planctomycetota bacterium]